MAKRNITFKELFELSNDIQLQVKSSPAFAHFNRAKVMRFLEENAFQLRAMERTINKLVDKYAMHDASNKPIVEIIQGQQQYKFLTEEAQTGYLQELNHFLKQTTFIND